MGIVIRIVGAIVGTVVVMIIRMRIIMAQGAIFSPSLDFILVKLAVFGASEHSLKKIAFISIDDALIFF